MLFADIQYNNKTLQTKTIESLMLSYSVTASLLTNKFLGFYFSISIGEHKPKQKVVEHDFDTIQLTPLRPTDIEYHVNATHLLDTTN